MFFSRELFLLLAIISAANGAPQVSALAGLPACASLGAVSAITASGCGTTDLACACNSDTFKTQFLAAATQNCSPADLATATTLSQQACEQVGVAASTETTAADPATDAPTSTTADAAVVAANTDAAAPTSPTVQADIGDAATATPTADPAADPADPPDSAAMTTSTTDISMLAADVTTTAPYAMGNGTTLTQCTACSCSTSSVGGVATFRGAASSTSGKSRAMKVIVSMSGLMSLMAMF